MRFGTFQGIQSKTLDSLRVGANGVIKFTFNTDKPSIGYLITAENKPYFLILDKNETIRMQGERLSYPESITMLEGKQNIAFTTYASEHPRREQALSAWGYLEKIYVYDSLFAVQQVPATAIQTEKKRIQQEDLQYLKSLDPRWYVSWYLPLRKLVSDVSTIAQYRTEEIPATVSAFRSLDYTDERLYRSGLLKDALESHFWLLENSGRSLDSVFLEMKVSIDSMFLHLVKNQDRLNEITDYLFDLLERHSLFQASEYLALKALNETSCTLNSDLAKQLETYRAMKKGNVAPDISFDKNLKSALVPLPKKLSDLQCTYTLIVFGASWCETCKQEVPKIASLYPKWKAKGLEVVFISLDETKEAFEQFVTPFPFTSYCDYGKWNSKVAADYYVFGTPTMFLLDPKRSIVLRPNSIPQMDAWVDWYLK
ncbi:MAG: TlpA family protein disulfide reductase [Flavobacteriia bacterium]|nr:TlpA family protein disulfide reductase [Flavobacteriia bacterium]